MDCGPLGEYEGKYYSSLMKRIVLPEISVLESLLSTKFQLRVNTRDMVFSWILKMDKKTIVLSRLVSLCQC